MGSHMPRFGLMHYLACFTLFDGDPHRVNTILDGFLEVTPARNAVASRRNIWFRRIAPCWCAVLQQWRWRSDDHKFHGCRVRRAAAPPLGPDRPVAWPKRTLRTLSNGMQVVLAESRAFPKISAQLFFRSGNAVVAQSNPGIAGMTATVVRTGTITRNSRQIEEDLRRMGADLGSHAGADTSAISVSGLAEFSRALLELVADLARNASFPGGRIRARTPPALRGAPRRAHDARLSRQ